MLRMRRPEGRKADSRQRIVDAAGCLFRQYGIDGVGVDAIMHAAGLTHGGFYGHFSSKEALVAEVCSGALARSAAAWERISHEREPAEALRQIVGPYLDLAHATAVESGCVLATLGPEVARRSEARAGMARSVQAMLAALERCMPDAPQSQVKAALSAMVGAVVLARVTDDRATAKGFLDAAKEAVLRGEAGRTRSAVKDGA
jgi:TetR/AcrR family transcriptional regulator, transcriptional repressor for nem operon